MTGLTREQAVAMYEGGWWIGMAARDIAMFQLHERLLCMPFDAFHRAVEKALGRPVYTHEFGLDMDGLRRELLGDRPAPTFEEILDLLPAEKRVVIDPRELP